MSDGINSSKMMNLALTSKGQLRNCLPMSNPFVHTRRAGVCPCTQLSFWYFSMAQNSESNSCCGSLESCSGSGGRSLSWGGHSGRIQQGATLDILKKIVIDWNLTGRSGSVVHLPSDDLRQVLGGDRRRGGAAESGDTSRSSRTETISTTRPHSPNASATRGNLGAI